MLQLITDSLRHSRCLFYDGLLYVLSDLISHINNITQIAEYHNNTHNGMVRLQHCCLYAFLRKSYTNSVFTLFWLHHLIIKSVFFAWFSLGLCNPVTRADTFSKTCSWSCRWCMQWPWVLRLDSFTYIRPLFSRGFSKSKHSIDNVSFTLCTALFPYFHSLYHLGDGRQHGSIECENWRLAIDRPISARVA